MRLHHWAIDGQTMSTIMAPSWLATTEPAEFWKTGQVGANLVGPAMAHQHCTGDGLPAYYHQFHGCAVLELTFTDLLLFIYIWMCTYVALFIILP